MADRVNALKEWTGLSNVTVLFDSMTNEFSHAGLFNTINGKSNVAVIGFTTDGDVFGGYYTLAETAQDNVVFDPTMFAFSFESHGRCATPKKFVPKGTGSARVWVHSDYALGFMTFVGNADGWFILGNERSTSACNRLSTGFEDLEDTTLTGNARVGDFLNPHHCCRLIAVQLV